MIKNYFQELHDKGITNCELSAKELQDLLAQDRITVDQFTKVMIANIGQEAFIKAFESTLRETYKDFKL